MSANTMKSSSREDTASREVVITRLLDAPRTLVYKAFTEPEHLIKWWGPKGFTNTFQEINIAPGGSWRFIMHGPDGVDYPNLIVFEEVVPNEKLTYMHGSGEENDPGKFFVTITFETKGNKTLLTMRSLFETAEARDFVVKEFGAIEGGNQTIDKLEEALRSMA